jgi:hypothetical protein
MRLAAALVALLLFGEGAALARAHKRIKRPKPAPSAGSDAEGRSHLKKANALAGHDDCEAAIEEYTLAFDKLNDPAVLLARANCRQKIGQNAEAAEDYRAYLDESPDVVDRADIEAKIAALERAPAAAASSKPAPPRETPAMREPSPAKEAARPPESPPSIAPAPPAPSVTEEAHPLVGAVVTNEPAAVAPRPAAGHRRLWLWTAVGVLVAGGAAAAGYFYFQPKQPTPPATDLGNYHF